MKNIKKIILLACYLSYAYGMEIAVNFDGFAARKRSRLMLMNEDENNVPKSTCEGAIRRRDPAMPSDAVFENGAIEGVHRAFPQSHLLEYSVNSLRRVVRSVSRVQSVAPERELDCAGIPVATLVNSYVAMLLDPVHKDLFNSVTNQYAEEANGYIRSQFGDKPPSHKVVPTFLHEHGFSNTTFTFDCTIAHMTFFMPIKKKTVDFLDQCVQLGCAQSPRELQAVSELKTQNPLRDLLHLYKTKNSIEKWDFAFRPASVIKQNEMLLLTGSVSGQLQKFRECIAPYFCYQLNIPYGIDGISAAARNVFCTVKNPKDFLSYMNTFKILCNQYYEVKWNCFGKIKGVFQSHHMMWYILLSELEAEKKRGNFGDVGICHIAAACRVNEDFKAQDNEILDYFRRREFAPHIRLLSITGNKSVKKMEMIGFHNRFDDCDLMLSDLMCGDGQNLTKHVHISQTSSSGSDGSSSDSHDLTDSSASDDDIQKRIDNTPEKRRRKEYSRKEAS